MRPSRYAFPAALLCAAGLSIGLCFCVITSFAVPVDPVRLLLACFLAAALFSAVFLLKKSWIWLLVVLLLAGAGGYLLRAELRQSLSALVYAVSSNYADAIPGLQAVSLTEDASGVDATLVLILIAALYALLCSWTVMRGEHLAYLLAGVLPVLVLCLVILQTPPAAWAILLVVGVLALLLLSQLLRARAGERGQPTGPAAGCAAGAAGRAAGRSVPGKDIRACEVVGFSAADACGCGRQAHALPPRRADRAGALHLADQPQHARQLPLGFERHGRESQPRRSAAAVRPHSHARAGADKRPVSSAGGFSGCLRREPLEGPV